MSPYKDKGKQRAYWKDKKRAQRDVHPKDVHPKMSTPTEYPAILEVLIDPVQRRKLEKVCLALKKRGLQEEVRYGVYGPSFKVVGDWLDATG